jgi:hypothetical protein
MRSLHVSAASTQLPCEDGIAPLLSYALPRHAPAAITIATSRAASRDVRRLRMGACARCLTPYAARLRCSTLHAAARTMRSPHVCARTAVALFDDTCGLPLPLRRCRHRLHAVATAHVRSRCASVPLHWRVSSRVRDIAARGM